VKFSKFIVKLTAMLLTFALVVTSASTQEASKAESKSLRPKDNDLSQALRAIFWGYVGNNKDC